MPLSRHTVTAADRWLLGRLGRLGLLEPSDHPGKLRGSAPRGSGREGAGQKRALAWGLEGW